MSKRFLLKLHFCHDQVECVVNLYKAKAARALLLAAGFRKTCQLQAAFARCMSSNNQNMYGNGFLTLGFLKI